MTIKEFITNQSDLICGKRCSLIKIEKAEQALGLEFSDEFKEYLMSFSVAMFNGHEFTGISKNDRINVVSATKNEWNNSPMVMHDLYVIEQLNIDGIVIWQDNRGNVYQSSFNTKPEKIFDSLLDYLESLI